MTNQVITQELVSALAERTDGEHGYEDLLSMFRAQEFFDKNRWIFRDDIYGLDIECSISRMISAVLEEYKQHLELEE